MVLRVFAFILLVFSAFAMYFLWINRSQQIKWKIVSINKILFVLATVLWYTALRSFCQA
jgi:cytochrome c oxidase assembly factor CtaG